MLSTHCVIWSDNLLQGEAEVERQTQRAGIATKDGFAPLLFLFLKGESDTGSKAAQVELTRKL
jgi:hypothetical protein